MKRHEMAMRHPSLIAFVLPIAVLALCASCIREDVQPEPFEVSKVVLPNEESKLEAPTPEPPDHGEVKSGEPVPPVKKPSASEFEGKSKSEEPVQVARVPAHSPPPPKPSDAALETMKVKAPERGKGAFLTDKSFVTRWNILGPIALPTDVGDDFLHAEYMPDEKVLDGSRNAPDRASWHVKVFKSAEPPGLIDFGRIFSGIAKRSAFYAVSCLDCEDDLNGLDMHVGSSGSVKVWINGVLVHAYDKGAREAAMDQETIGGITLKDGYNRVVVKYVDPADAASVGAGRKFFLRFSMPDGLPVSAEP